MSNNQTRQLEPKLRFPEFQEAGAWQEKQLKEISEPIVEKVGSRKFTPVSITAGVGFVAQADKFGRDISGNQYKGYIYLKRGDFAYNKGNSKKYAQGYVCQLNNFDQAAASSAFICFRLQDGYEAEFLQGLFDKNLHGVQLARYITSGARSDGLLNIRAEDFFGITLPIPSQRAEQQKIADCLSSLDELIAAETQKLGTLKRYKKGLMQQLFPVEGETVPRLRFPEFQDAGEWEVKSLGNLGDVLMCKRIFASETSSIEEVPFYKIGTLGGSPDAYISRKLFEEYKSRYKFPRLGEVLITCSGTIGKCLPYDGRDAYYQDSNIVWIDNPSQEVSNEFLLCILSNVNWDKLNKNTITRIYGPDLRNLLIRFPTHPSEQKKVTDFLSSLDDNITAQSQRIGGLKLHKKGLMQQLFPSPSEVSA